jgi:hypothetical protein
MPFLEKAWRTMSAPSFKKWLEVMPLSRMAEWGNKNVPGLTKLYHLGTQKIGQLHTYQRRFNDITKQLVAVANKNGKEVLAEVAYYTRINRVDVTELGDTLADSYNADRPLQWYATELNKQNISPARRKRLDKAALRREGEIKAVDKVLNSDEKPLTAIVGGAKVSSKITIIERLLGKVDNLIVGGGMAYTFVKAMGGQVGNSLVEDDYLETARKILADAKTKGVNLYIPTDTIIADKFDNDANRQEVKIGEIPAGWMGLDTGSETSKACREIIANSKLILWNGPMGVFEMENFQQGTVDVANAIVEATANGAFSLIGGGDSVAAINKFNLADKVSYVSTGGGAMLEYLEGIELPGIKAIREN